MITEEECTLGAGLKRALIRMTGGFLLILLIHGIVSLVKRLRRTK